MIISLIILSSRGMRKRRGEMRSYAAEEMLAKQELPRDAHEGHRYHDDGACHITCVRPIPKSKFHEEMYVPA